MAEVLIGPVGPEAAHAKLLLDCHWLDRKFAKREIDGIAFGLQLIHPHHSLACIVIDIDVGA